jgi:hypothetical protein
MIFFNLVLPMFYRNYQPESEILREGVLDPTKPADVDTLVEEQVADANKAAKSLQQVSCSASLLQSLYNFI